MTNTDDSCKRCGAPGEITLRRNRSCRDCFFFHNSRIVKGALVKENLIPRESEAVFAFSGSTSSCALLHFLLQATVPCPPSRPMTFSLRVVHIDEGGAFGWDQDKRAEAVAAVKACAENVGSKFDIDTKFESVGLESVFEEKESDSLQALFDFQDATRNDDVLRSLRLKALLRAARRMGSQAIVTCETADTVATRTLSQICQGRGYGVACDVGYADTRFDGVRIVRPFRDVTREEASYYAQWKDLQPVSEAYTRTHTQDDETPSQSVESLVDHFLQGLQRDFPSTVHTVQRTGSKTKVPDAVSSQDRDAIRLCALCSTLLPAEYNEGPNTFSLCRCCLQFELPQEAIPSDD
eukprot:Rmarinus@m.12703